MSLNIHVFTPTNCIGCPFPILLSLFLSLLPTFISMIISSQLVSTDRARIVLILSNYKDIHILSYLDWFKKKKDSKTSFESAKNSYQPRFEARRMKHVLAWQLLHLVLYHQFLLANGAQGIFPELRQNSFCDGRDRKICNDFLACRWNSWSSRISRQKLEPIQINSRHMYDKHHVMISSLLDHLVD